MNTTTYTRAQITAVKFLIQTLYTPLRLVCMIISHRISIPFSVYRHPSILTGMHFQSDDEEPGSSESTAERGLREEMLRHFVPVNMLSERTVERMKKMEGRRSEEAGIGGTLL